MREKPERELAAIGSLASANYLGPHSEEPAPRRRILLWLKCQEVMMDKQHIKGGAKDIKGSVKEAVGKATGSRRTEAEGKADSAEGKARKAVGDVKDALKR